jgi:general secretion pathway protein E
MKCQRLGELLRGRELVSDRELADALALQSLAGGLRGQLLIRTGALSEVDLLAVLSDELGLAVLAAGEAPAAAQVARFLAEIRSPLAWWAQRQAIAWRAGEAADAPVMCAAVNPLDAALRDRLAQVDGPVQYRLARHAVIAGLLEEIGHGAQAEAAAGGQSETARLRELAQETPVIDFVNSLFAEALARRASDLHIEPFADHFVVRMRIDGQLVTARTAPRSRFDAVCSRIKLLSGMDIGERRLPQDGRQSIRIAGQELDLRISSLPSVWGESVVLRLLGRSDRLPELAELGVSADQAQQLLGLVEKPNGVVLVSGPTGSGKTTTIYRLLLHLNNGVRKIVTVEDPVEFDLPGVVQMQVRSDIGLSFAAGLRSILRQDPDVIMIGEIRDRETARIAVQAALTGHLVISTIHTNSALAAAPRLLDLEVEPFLLADVLRGLVGQRLVRRLCPHCARPSDVDRAAGYEAMRPAMARLAGAAAWREPAGCARCGHSGYLGRLGLFEIVVSAPGLEHDIRQRASEEQLVRTARATGYVSLAEDGWAKARAGLTSLAEVRRAAGDGAEGRLAVARA